MRRDPLDGATCVRFGPYEALTSASTIQATNTKKVWRVWLVWTDEMAHLVNKRMMSRAEAVAEARRLAVDWRAAGRPELLIPHKGDSQ